MTKRAAVEPHQVSTFQRGHRDAGQLAGEGLAHEPLVLPEIRAQGVQPALGLVVGRLQGRHAEDIDVAALVVVDGAVDAAHNVQIPGDDVRDLDTGDVERLCRRAAGAGIPDQFIRQRRERHIAGPGTRQFAVDLVRNHENAVAEADLPYPQEFLAGPYPAHGIVGIAEQHRRRAAVRSQRLELLEVHLEAPVPAQERIDRLAAAVVSHRREECIVAGRLHDHAVPRTRKSLDRGGIGRNHARGRDHLLARNALPAMPAGEPRSDRIEIILRHQLIAENAVLDPPPERSKNGRRGLEIHIRHPQRQHIGSILVPLHRFGADPGRTTVEIVFHNVGSPQGDLLS